MITVTKTKNEIKEGSPHRIVTIDIDLEDIQTVSRNMTHAQFYQHIGEIFSRNFNNVIKCKT